MAFFDVVTAYMVKFLSLVFLLTDLCKRENLHKNPADTGVPTNYINIRIGLNVNLRRGSSLFLVSRVES